MRLHSFTPSIGTAWPARAATLAAFALLSVNSLRPTVAITPTSSTGVYVDGNGVKQTWHVDGAHRLIWDSKPFVPVGGLFQARSWAPDATAADWQADKDALALLKKHDVIDVYLQPARGFGLTDVPAPAIQRMIDLLDALGFTYGISIMDGPRVPLAGYVVRPGVYRQEVTSGADSVRVPAEDFLSYLYLVVNANDHGDSEVLASGDSRPSEGSAVVAIPPQVSQFGDLGAKIILNLVPQKEFRPGEKNSDGTPRIGYPDLWGGFDDYRDRLLSLFRSVRLGKGFRFFVDALPPTLTLDGTESEHLVPTGSGFTTEWEAYLSRNYKSLEKLDQAWGVSDHEAKDIGEMAMFVPLWSNHNGVPDFYDRVTKKLIGVETRRSNFWSDLANFKSDSIQRYMNDLALSLKRAVADVPVVYRSNGYSTLFRNLTDDEGFDGIGIVAYGHGAELVQNSAGRIYSQTTQSMRTLWLPVTATADAAPADKTAPGYASRLVMQSDFDYLREIGARGFYVDALQTTGTAQSKRDIDEVPEQLDWLAGYQHLLVATGVSAAETVPDVAFYPMGSKIAGVKHNMILLPTDRPAVAYDFGSVGSAYALSEPTGVVYYLYTVSNPHTVHIRIPSALSKAPGVPPVDWLPHVAGELHKDTLVLTIGPDPVRILNLSNYIPVPTEAFGSLREEAHKLLTLMKQRNILEAPRYTQELSEQELVFKSEQPMPGIQKIQALIKEMRTRLQPYAWIEAEKAVGQTFDEVSIRAGASGGQVLIVDPRPKGAPAAIATYAVEVKEDGPYEVWAAASPNAPLTYSLDGSAMIDHATLPQKVGAPYAEGTLVWQRYGTATLPHGSHTLQIRANGPAAVDVILLIKPDLFRPDGTNQPPILP